MLAVQEGVLVGADRRQGNTLSLDHADTASKILPMGHSGLATGWGLAALHSEFGNETRVDMFEIISAASTNPQFKFDEHGYRAIGGEWVRQMREHLRRTPVREWPETPTCGYWFKNLFVYSTTSGIKADEVTYLYRRQYPAPHIDLAAGEVIANFVAGGSLLVEGDRSGMVRIENGSAEFSVLPETKKAWLNSIDATQVSTELGARIIKDALYANHLYGERHNGAASVGSTCDIAFISREHGFRWYERNVRTAPG